MGILEPSSEIFAIPFNYTVPPSQSCAAYHQGLTDYEIAGAWRQKHGEPDIGIILRISFPAPSQHPLGYHHP